MESTEQIIQQQLLPLQPPYPIITCKGMIFEQIATLLVQNENKYVYSFPVVKDDLYIPGQLWDDWIGDERTPDEFCLNLNCHRGSKISWEAFMNIVMRIGLNSLDMTEMDVDDIYDKLKSLNVTIESIPDIFNLTVELINDKLDFYSNNMVVMFKNRGRWTVNENFLEGDFLENFLENVKMYLRINKDAKFHFVFDKRNRILHDKVKKLMDEIKKLKTKTITIMKSNQMDLWIWRMIDQSLQEMTKFGSMTMKDVVKYINNKLLQNGYQLDDDCEEQILNYIKDSFDNCIDDSQNNMKIMLRDSLYTV